MHLSIETIKIVDMFTFLRGAYIRVFIFYQHIKYHLLNMLKMKCDINQQDLKRVDTYFVKSEIFFTHLKLWIASAKHNFK